MGFKSREPLLWHGKHDKNDGILGQQPLPLLSVRALDNKAPAKMTKTGYRRYIETWGGKIEKELEQMDTAPQIIPAIISYLRYNWIREFIGHIKGSLRQFMVEKYNIDLENFREGKFKKSLTSYQ